MGSKKGLKGVVAGGFAGGVEICITYPTEYVKTQLQLDGRAGGQREYSSAMDVVRKTVKRHGPRGLYRGLSVLVTGSVPKAAVRFGAFEKIKLLMEGERGVLSPHERALCGLLAGVTESIFVVTPMETVKVKLINDQRSEKPRFRGLFHGVTTIAREQGLHGLYQGLVPTTIKQGSNQAVRFFCMETLKHAYTGGDKTVVVPKYVIALCGILAGMASVYSNNPVDVVKTRMQGLEASRYKGSWDCVRKVWQEEGFAGFYKGSVPRMTRVCMDTAITFTMYEIVMDLFNKMWP